MKDNEIGRKICNRETGSAGMPITEDRCHSPVGVKLGNLRSSRNRSNSSSSSNSSLHRGERLT